MAKKIKKSLPKKLPKAPKNSTQSIKQKIRPTGDRVLLREELKDVQEKTLSGIIIPVTSDKDSGTKKGTVVAVGPGKYEDGKLVPVAVSPGDTVLFQWGEKVIIDGEEYTVVREGEIIATL